MSVTVKDVVSIAHTEARNIASLRRRSFVRVSTDSRTVAAGDLFVAIRGDKFDGHLFVEQAFKKGAACAIIDDRATPTAYKNQPHVVVPDTTKALGELARVHRRRFSIPVLAIAGSNGKTTTKDMVAGMLKTKYRVLSTPGNLNNHIGVPMTLFGLTSRHDVAVIEVGTNHFGEVRDLCKVLEPTHGLITNIGHEHLEFFGDIEGVADAEAELFLALGSKGVGFVNVDDERIVARSKRLRKTMSYGFAPRARTRGILKSMGTDGCALFTVRSRRKPSFDVALGIPGKHAMHNALAAAAVGIAFDVPARNIQRSLGKFRPAGKRMEIVRRSGVTIVNDTYNANSDSVISALETLKEMECAGSRIIILADMLELGGAARVEHERIGAAVKSMGFSILLTYGPLAEHSAAAAKGIAMNFHYDQKNALAEYAAELIAPGDIILIKGSRGMRMEDVVTFLLERIGNKTK